MDPEGVRELFYAECGAAADYGVRRALGALPFMVRPRESTFTGLALPLTVPLPKRLDTFMAQRTGLHAYDAVVLADIDPVVFDATDLLNLETYVEAGGGLLLLAGPNSFCKAQRHWGPLRAVLPADYTLAPQKKTKLWNDAFPPEPAREPLPVALRTPHPVTRGLSGSLGTVLNAYPLRPAAGAAVLAEAGGAPVIVAGTHGAGRIIMVAACPSGGAACLYRTAAWDDLLRQALAWLMKRDADLVIDEAALDTTPLESGGAREFALLLDAAVTGAGELRCTASARRADPGWLSAGREPQWGEAVPLPVTLTGAQARARFAPPQPGLWQVTLTVAGAKWANTRVVTIPVRTPLGLQLFTRDGEFVTASGRTLALELRAAKPVPVTLRLVDADGGMVLTRALSLAANAAPQAPANDRTDQSDPSDQSELARAAVELRIPQLELGDYELVAEAPDGDTAHLRVCVTAETRRPPVFAVVGTAHFGPTEERTRWWFEHMRSRGFNAFGTGAGARAPQTSAPATFQAGPFQRYLVQREGFDLWGDGWHTAKLSTHAHYGAEGTKLTTPCVLSPEYPAALRQHLEDEFRASDFPRLVSREILDEPHLMRANVCHCEHCQRRFRDRFGYDLPTWEEALAARDQRTADYFEWVVDYAAEAFRQGYATWKALGPGPWLHHILCGAGSGQQAIGYAVAEDHPWIPHADFLEFDCYNYMYPNFRCSHQIRWAVFHYLAGHFRFQSLRHNRRFGFWIQVTDREIPVAPYDPLRAPSETLYTAIGAGAKHFHLMCKGPFSNSQNCREEKFDTFAGDIRKVQRVAPLLDRAVKPRSRIAMVFPFHDRLYRPPAHRLPPNCRGLGFYGAESRPIDTLWPYHMASVNVAELLFRAFGEVDVIDQRALRDGALDDYAGFVITGTEYMDARDAAAVRRFVENGGALVCDHVPTRDLAGKPLAPLGDLFAAATIPFYRDVTTGGQRCGRGATLLFSQDLNELYSGSIEQDNAQLRQQLEDTLHEFFFGHGLRPRCRCDNDEIEANPLETPDTRVLVLVNHGETRRQGRVIVYAAPGSTQKGFDLITMAPVAVTAVPEGLAIDVDMSEREGLIIGLYPTVPLTSVIRPQPGMANRGGRLAFAVELLDAQGQRVRGDHIVELTVTDPKGEVHRQFGGLRCASNGLLTIDEPLGVNARTGTWILTAFDRFTRCQVTTSVQVEG